MYLLTLITEGFYPVEHITLCWFLAAVTFIISSVSRTLNFRTKPTFYYGSHSS